MEILVELILEIFFELVIGALFEWLGWIAGKAIETRTGRTISLWLLMCATGFGGGVAWGAYVASSNVVHTPRTIWVTLVIAVVATVLAFMARSDRESNLARVGVQRYCLFAAFNVSIAAGVALGYTSTSPA